MSNKYLNPHYFSGVIARYITFMYHNIKNKSDIIITCSYLYRGYIMDGFVDVIYAKSECSEWVIGYNMGDDLISVISWVTCWYQERVSKATEWVIPTGHEW